MLLIRHNQDGIVRVVIDGVVQQGRELMAIESYLCRTLHMVGNSRITETRRLCIEAALEMFIATLRNAGSRQDIAELEIVLAKLDEGIKAYTRGDLKNLGRQPHVTISYLGHTTSYSSQEPKS